MSYSISTLLTRNLHDVFGENDPTRGRAASDEIFTEDGVFHEPSGIYHSREEIDRVAGKIKAGGDRGCEERCHPTTLILPVFCKVFALVGVKSCLLR